MKYIKCPKCGGSGYIPVRDVEKSKKTGVVTLKNYTCTCDRCGGSGRVPK